jgi:hypothetical protein
VSTRTTKCTLASAVRWDTPLDGPHRKRTFSMGSRGPNSVGPLLWRPPLGEGGLYCTLGGPWGPSADGGTIIAPRRRRADDSSAAQIFSMLFLVPLAATSTCTCACAQPLDVHSSNASVVTPLPAGKVDGRWLRVDHIGDQGGSLTFSACDAATCANDTACHEHVRIEVMRGVCEGTALRSMTSAEIRCAHQERSVLELNARAGEAIFIHATVLSVTDGALHVHHRAASSTTQPPASATLETRPPSASASTSEHAAALDIPPAAPSNLTAAALPLACCDASNASLLQCARTRTGIERARVLILSQVLHTRTVSARTRRPRAPIAHVPSLPAPHRHNVHRVRSRRSQVFGPAQGYGR